MIVKKEEFYHIKLLLKKDRKKGSKISRVAKETGWSPETIRCINKFQTFEKYQARKGTKKTNLQKPVVDVPNLNINVFEEGNYKTENILPLVLSVILVVVIILFLIFK